MRKLGTIQLLNRLVRTCRNGEEFCRICSDTARSSDLRTMLRYRSEEWGRLGDELQALVLLLGGEPAIAGTFAARMRQVWVMLTSAVTGHSDRGVIEEWYNAQQHALDRYEEALRGYLPERIRRTVSLQADRIADRLVQIESLRGQYAVRSQGA